MINAMARKLALELAGAYPGRGIEDVTIAQYAAALEPEDVEVASRAVGDLVVGFPDRAPTLGQLHEALRLRRPQQDLLPPHEDTGYGKRSRETSPEDVDHWNHGMAHLAELLDAPRDKRTEEMRRKAEHPETCDCDQRAPYLSPAAMVEDIGKDVTRIRRRAS